MKIVLFDYLSDDARMIRKKVFMDEQGFENEFDDTDEIASHIVMYNEKEEPVATCRFFESSEKNNFIFGRLAVIVPYRGMDIGTKMINAAEKFVMKMGGTSVSLHAQCRVKNFYEKSGYTAFGETDDDEGCPHVWMRKQIL